MDQSIDYRCYYCDEPLCEINSSIEHIIPNALGGKLKSKKLLCKKCNSTLGDFLDAEISKSLLPITALLCIRREKRVIPNLKNIPTLSGEKFHLENGITPIPIAPKIIINKEANNLQIRARDEKEIRHIIQRLQKKYPHLDVVNLEKKLNRTQEFLKEPLQIDLSLGSPVFMKAILKMSINFYLSNTNRPNDIKDRIADLRSNLSLNPEIVKHYYAPELSSNKSKEEVAHTLLVCGIKQKQLLYAYVELFSSCSFIVNLNTAYEGPDLNYHYSYDVLSQSEIEKEISIDYNGNVTGDLAELNLAFINLLQSKLDRVFAIGNSRQINTIIAQKIEEAVEEDLKRQPGEKEFTTETIEALVHSVSKKLAPYLAHFSNKGGK